MSLRKVIFGIIILSLVSCTAHIKRKEFIQGKISGYPVTAEAQIIYDQYGIPHIRASNDQDLFFALGYAMAQDRFFQMDIFRRFGRGEICELLGRVKFWKIDFINIDKLTRALNYKGRAEQGYQAMPEETRVLLNAFTQGVNQYLKDAGETIPQYRFFRTKPAPWRPEDSLVCADVFGLAMSYGSLGTEYYYTRIAREFGPDKAKIFLPIYPDDAPIVVEDIPQVADNSGLEHLIASVRWILTLGTSPGSNNWVIAPDRSLTGSAIINNDPHVPIYPFPTYWYLCHLQGGSFNIIGMMFPGLPAFGAGYNGEIAWVLTNASVDHIDLFIEKLNPENPNQYLYKNEWRELKIREEVIPLKKGKSVKVKIRETIHGPIIDGEITGVSFPTGGPEQVYAFKIVDVELGKFLQGYLDMARATNWQEFVEGLKNMHLGPVAWNHIFADKRGNIGYWLSGHCPIRPDNQGWLARKGWTGDQDWRGYIPFDQLPHIYNPKQKYIATANNKNRLDDYPYYLGAEYALSRIQRIDEVLRSKDKFSVEDMKALQLDVVVVSARNIVPILLSDLSESKNPKLDKAVWALKHWQEQGYQASIDSIGTTVYELFLKNMVSLSFDDELKKMTFVAGLLGGVTMTGLENIMDDPNNYWFDDKATKKIETRKEIVEKAGLKTIEYLEKKFGSNPQSWEWGKISHSYFYTPAGFLPITGKRHRIGKFPREGASGTVNNNEGFFLGPLGYLFIGGPTTRMIVDFSDPGHFHFNQTTGNSENIKSPRCANLTKSWVKGEYLSLSMNPEEYEKDALGILWLKR